MELGMCPVIFLAVWSLLVLHTHSDVFTSMNRIKAMVMEEEQILDSLREALVENNQEAVITEFYARRLKQIRHRNNYLDSNQVAHPNMAYSFIKEFANEYQQLRQNILANRTPKLYTILSRIADEDDLAGAKVSLLRLQEVYNLTVSDMANGNYRNFMGPPMSAYDVYTVAQAAFLHGKLQQTVDWLTLALHMVQRPVGTIDDMISDVTTMASVAVPLNSPSVGAIEALLGRAYLRQNNRALAEAYLKKSQVKEPSHGDVFLLRDELKTLNPDHFKEPHLIDELKNFHRLCSIQNKMTNTESKSWCVCRYVHVFLPYYQFKEEILSKSPFVSLFYDVISDSEAAEVISYSKEQLFRGGVVGSKGVETSGIRTSHIGFFDDAHSPTISSISKRITYLTGLNTDISDKGFYSKMLSAAEPIQVVNYGIGGHYSVHMDPYEDRNSATAHILDNFGNRMATFLIYLTHVELGGSTAFPNIDLVVAPVKNSAVFWYSYSPNGEMDRRTRHAGCPVVVGEKWVTNKWILSYGQTFSRRCGMNKDASQLDIEKDMRRGYKPYRRRK